MGREKKILKEGIGNLLPVGLVTQALDVTRPTLTQWKEKGFPPTNDGLIDALDVIAWLRKQWVETREEEAAMAPDVDSPNLERYRAAKADILEMDRDKKREQLVDITTANLTVHKILTSCWTKIVHFRDRLPAVLQGKTAQQIRNLLVEETDRAAEELRAEMEKLKDA